MKRIIRYSIAMLLVSPLVLFPLYFAAGCYTPGPNDPSAADIHDAADTHLKPPMRHNATNSMNEVTP